MDRTRFQDPRFMKWAFAVKKRDGFQCCICHLTDVELNAHHMDGWEGFPKERYALKNGVTLCAAHHEHFHESYGWGENTRVQFDEYFETCRLLRKKALLDSVVRDIEEKESWEGSEGPEEKLGGDL